MTQTELSRLEREAAVTWAGAQESNWLKVEGLSASLILDLPAAFTGTELTFDRKLADGTASPIYRNGAEVTNTVPGSTKCSTKLDVDALFGVGIFRIKSDQSETASGTLRVAG